MASVTSDPIAEEYSQYRQRYAEFHRLQIRERRKAHMILVFGILAFATVLGAIGLWLLMQVLG